MPESYERVLVGWQCAKVKGCVELKIDKPQSKDLFHLHPNLKRLRSLKGHVTSYQGQSKKNQRGTQGPPVIIHGVVAFKKS